MKAAQTILACTLALGLLAGVWTSVVAAKGGPEDPAREELLRQEKEKFLRALNKERSLLRRLRQIDSGRRQRSAELTGLEAELKTARMRVQENRRVHSEAQQRLGQAKARAALGLRAIYLLSRGGGARYLFSGSSIGSLIKRFHTAVLLFREDLAELAMFRDSLEASRERDAQLLENMNQLESLVERIRQKSLEVEIERTKRVALLEMFRNDREFHERAIRELDESEKLIQKEVNGLLGSAGSVGPSLDFASNKGYLDTPVKGAVVSYFGKKIHRKFGTVTFNKGIDIRADEGAPVAVVYDGVVSMVREFLGYGTVMIVDHGKRYHTLYGHLEGDFPAVNRKVRRGEVIGRVGGTGSIEGSVLHFEIRHQGKALDPLRWIYLPAKKTGEVR